MLLDCSDSGSDSDGGNGGRHNGTNYRSSGAVIVAATRGGALPNEE